MLEQDKYYLEIKDRLIDVELTEKVKNYTSNRVKLENYYEIGKLIIEVDKNIKKIKHNKTVGIILWRKDYKLILEYCSDFRIITREYILNCFFLLKTLVFL